jgi:hypothetical protein
MGVYFIIHRNTMTRCLILTFLIFYFVEEMDFTNSIIGTVIVDNIWANLADPSMLVVEI